MDISDEAGRRSVLHHLRHATGATHRRLESRFNAVAQLSDPSRRPAAMRRYASLYQFAQTALAPALEDVPGLDLSGRRQAWRSASALLPEVTAAPFPEPADRSEALGVLYVIDGSTLGGRAIRQELRKRGVVDAMLAFLEPYGAASGRMWRGLLAILEREGSRAPACLGQMCRGASRAFGHAEDILCGELP